MQQKESVMYAGFWQFLQTSRNMTPTLNMFLLWLWIPNCTESIFAYARWIIFPTLAVWYFFEWMKNLLKMKYRVMGTYNLNESLHAK